MWGMRGRFRGGRSGGASATLLALVLLFRLLIPAGYMIAPGDDGRPGLILCGAAAAAAIEDPAPHEGHHPADPAPSKAADPPCPYAAQAAPVLPPSPPIAPPQPLAADGPLPPTPAAALAKPALAAPPPPATGPPSSV